MFLNLGIWKQGLWFSVYVPGFWTNVFWKTGFLGFEHRALIMVDEGLEFRKRV